MLLTATLQALLCLNQRQSRKAIATRLAPSHRLPCQRVSIRDKAERLLRLRLMQDSLQMRDTESQSETKPKGYCDLTRSVDGHPLANSCLNQRQSRKAIATGGGCGADCSVACGACLNQRQSRKAIATVGIPLNKRKMVIPSLNQRQSRKAIATRRRWRPVPLRGLASQSETKPKGYCDFFLQE